MKHDVVAWMIGMALYGSVAMAADIVVEKPLGTGTNDGIAQLQAEPMAESRLVGANQQPEWTTHRRFTTSRVYVQQPAGEYGFEQWVRSKFFDGERGEHQIIEEVEIGLPHRMQLDLYERFVRDSQGDTAQDEMSAELRYALADWGKIPLNPTLYFEYAFANADSDVGEAKVLFGDELANGWHWGANLSYEWRFGGDFAKEYMGTASISKTIIDSKLGVGIEGLYASESVEGTRGDPENSLEVGPSIQWRPTAHTHLDLVPLFGITDDAPNVESFVVFGYDFGEGNESVQAITPTSSKID